MRGSLDRTEPGRRITNDRTAEVMQSARSKLLDLEVVLREQWYDSVEVAPTLAARLTVAARLIRNAAEALASDTVL